MESNTYAEFKSIKDRNEEQKGEQDALNRTLVDALEKANLEMKTQCEHLRDALDALEVKQQYDRAESERKSSKVEMQDLKKQQQEVWTQFQMEQQEIRVQLDDRTAKWEHRSADFLASTLDLIEQTRQEIGGMQECLRNETRSVEEGCKKLTEENGKKVDKWCAEAEKKFGMIETKLTEFQVDLSAQISNQQQRSQEEFSRVKHGCTEIRHEVSELMRTCHADRGEWQAKMGNMTQEQATTLANLRNMEKRFSLENDEINQLVQELDTARKVNQSELTALQDFTRGQCDTLRVGLEKSAKETRDAFQLDLESAHEELKKSLTQFQTDIRAVTTDTQRRNNEHKQDLQRDLDTREENIAKRYQLEFGMKRLTELNEEMRSMRGHVTACTDMFDDLRKNVVKKSEQIEDVQARVANMHSDVTRFDHDLTDVRKTSTELADLQTDFRKHRAKIADWDASLTSTVVRQQQCTKQLSIVENKVHALESYAGAATDKVDVLEASFVGTQNTQREALARSIEESLDRLNAFVTCEEFLDFRNMINNNLEKHSLVIDGQIKRASAEVSTLRDNMRSLVDKQTKECRTSAADLKARIGEITMESKVRFRDLESRRVDSGDWRLTSNPDYQKPEMNSSERSLYSSEKSLWGRR